VAYYFLMAQLPSLIHGQNPPMSSVRFRDLAETGLSKADAAVLPYCSLIPQAIPGKLDCPFISAWYEWESSLRLNLARYRAAKLKREGPSGVHPYPQDAAAAAKAASSLESPLEAELLLDEFRWKAIEYFQGIQYFDRNTVYAYLLKLQLMERRSSFRTEEGFNEYKGLYAAVMGENK
jgi:hypothetical protein